MWIDSEGSLQPEDQQFGTWLRAPPFVTFRKNVVSIPGFFMKKRTENPTQNTSAPPPQPHEAVYMVASKTSTPSPMIINDFSEVLASHDQPREKSAIPIISEFPALDLPPKSTPSTGFERLIQEIDKGIHQFDKVDMRSVLSKEVTSDTKE